MVAEPLGTRYWNANIPRDQWTDACPEYLVGESEKDRRILSRRDDEAPRFSWIAVQELIRCNNIHRFERTSSQLRAYHKYAYYLKRQYGSVLAFIQRERLRWQDTTPSGDPPFANAADYKTLYNDWPYNVEAGIAHLVVWTKFLINDDEATGHCSDEAKAAIERFIDTTFCSPPGGIERERIVWFKNWTSLKSVHELEHFHIMLFQAPAALLESVTGGDQPTCKSWKEGRDG